MMLKKIILHTESRQHFFNLHLLNFIMFEKIHIRIYFGNFFMHPAERAYVASVMKKINK
jgi:hypothetical protein